MLAQAVGFSAAGAYWIAARALRAHPEITGIEVQGHTDSHGGDAYNLGLSQRRADAVGLYLIEKGIAADRLEFTLGGAGDTVSNR